MRGAPGQLLAPLTGRGGVVDMLELVDSVNQSIFNIVLIYSIFFNLIESHTKKYIIIYYIGIPNRYIE